MPVITGKDGQVLLNGVILGELLDWERVIEESVGIDASGQSDLWDFDEHLRNRWSVRGRVELKVSNYTTASKGALMGQLVQVVCKIDAVGAPGVSWFSGEGRLIRETTRAPQEDTVSMEIEVKGRGQPTLL